MKEYICVESPNEVDGGMLVREQELIRCKDCKLNPKRMWVGCPMAHCLDRTDEWYCPFGKPKKDEE